MFTENEEGDNITFYEGYDEQEEAEYVARAIYNLQSRGIALNEIGVLMRVSALSRLMEEKLLNYNLAYKVSGIFKFFERLEVKNVLAYLNMIVNPRDNSSITRIINYPKRGIGQATIDKLLSIAESEHRPMVDVVENFRELDLSSSIINKIAEFGDMITEFKKAYAEKSLYDFVKYVVDTSGVKDMYDTESEEDIDRRLNIDQLLQSVKSYEHLNPDATLVDYLESVTLQNNLEKQDDDLPSVAISTVHASKGLEFDYVFIIGAEEGKFPLSRALENNDELEEERRLMYVAITRARKKLYITRAKSRFLYGKRENQMASRFITEAGLVAPKPTFKSTYEYENSYEKSYTYGSNYNKTSSYDSYSSYTKSNDASSSYGTYNDYSKMQSSFGNKSNNINVLNSLQNMVNNKIEKQKTSFSDYKVGVQVLHAKFGVGTIIKVDDAGGNNYVSVDFGKIGVKTLSLNFAPLQILKK